MRTKQSHKFKREWQFADLSERFNEEGYLRLMSMLATLRCAGERYPGSRLHIQCKLITDQ